MFGSTNEQCVIPSCERRCSWHERQVWELRDDSLPIDEGDTHLVDSETTLARVPPAAWDYRLGNRSAIDWVLDQHKEKSPKDPTIRAKFDTYRFADHKERVIDLLARVMRVSVETMRIVGEIEAAPR